MLQTGLKAMLLKLIAEANSLYQFSLMIIIFNFSRPGLTNIFLSLNLHKKSVINPFYRAPFYCKAFLRALYQ